jgi:periplasmic divalent cation tolerance protein
MPEVTNPEPTDVESTHCMAVTTIDSVDAAQRLARGVVEARVGACAQIVGPITSVYRWKGEVRSDPEWQVWIKTTTARLDELAEHLRANHPYDVPELVATPIIGGSPSYLKWVTQETTGS